MQVSLAVGEIVCLDGGHKGVTVHCNQGLLWLTIGDGCDYFVSKGNQFFLKPGLSAVAEACKAAEMYLEKAEQVQMSVSISPALRASLPSHVSA